MALPGPPGWITSTCIRWDGRGLVTSNCIEVAMSWAATRLRERTGADVRVISGTIFRMWLKRVHWTEAQIEAHGNPPSMNQTGLEKADYVLIAYSRKLHWSFLVLCHPGTPIQFEVMCMPC